MQALDAIEIARLLETVRAAASKEKVTRKQVGALAEANIVIAKWPKFHDVYREILSFGIIHSNKPVFQLLLHSFNESVAINWPDENYTQVINR